MSIMLVVVRLQDADFDSQSQSSYDRALSERGHSQMSSDDTWKGKSNASAYTAHTTYKCSVLTHKSVTKVWGFPGHQAVALSGV